MVEDGHDLSELTTIMRGEAKPADVLQIGHFVSVSEAGATRRLRIGPAGLVVGRLVSCDICLPVSEVSRGHCRIELDGEGAVVVDLGSTNGTFVGGRRIEGAARLEHGAAIAVGPALLRYERRDEREVADEARLTAELRQAVDYVRAVLPEPIGAGPVQASWWYVPSSELGGDAFGYQFLDATTFVGFVVDVSGHGIGAGLHAANVAHVLRRRALPGVDFADPGAVASALNAMFPMEEHGGMIFTMWYFAYDLPSRRLRYCTAGHHAAFLAAPGEAHAAALWQRAPSIGMIAGRQWPSGEAFLPVGGRLYIFSDGAFEIVARDGQAWEIDHVRAIIDEAPAPAGGEPQRLYQAVRAAAPEGPLADDFSALVILFS